MSLLEWSLELLRYFILKKKSGNSRNEYHVCYEFDCSNSTRKTVDISDQPLKKKAYKHVNITIKFMQNSIFGIFVSTEQNSLSLLIEN